MQSSGASILTYVLGQTPGAYALVDQWCMHSLPSADDLPEDHLVIAKATISRDCTLEQHRNAYRPDRTILVLRHPYHNYVSLRRKWYSNLCGPLDDKFRDLEQVNMYRDGFDAVIRFEDLVFHNDAFFTCMKRIDIPLARDAFSFPNSLDDVVKRAGSIPVVRQGYENNWGIGNIREEILRPELVFKWVSPRLRRKIDDLCPLLVEDYRTYVEQSLGHWRVEAMGLFDDLLLSRIPWLSRHFRLHRVRAGT